MWPIIWEFDLFGLSITIFSFGTFIVLAFLVSAFYVRRRAARALGMDKEHVLNICFVLLFLGLVGARLLYAFIHHEEFSTRPLSFLYIWEGGLVFYGGLLLGLFWLGWYLPRQEHGKRWALTDTLALGGCLAVFVGRFASLFSGENYGKLAEGFPLAIKFPPLKGSAVPPEMREVALHPTQIYHSVWALAMFVALWLYMRRKPAPWPGRATGLFLALYATGTLLVEFWRADDVARGMVIGGYVSLSQLLSIPVFFAGIAIFLIRRRPSDAPA